MKHHNDIEITINLNMNSSVYQHGHGIVMIPLKGPIVIMFIVMFIMNIVLVNFYCFSPRYKPNLRGEKTNEFTTFDLNLLNNEKLIHVR